MATRIMVALVWVTYASSFDQRRYRPRQAKVRSTIQRVGSRRTPLIPSGRLTSSRRTLRQGRRSQTQAMSAPAYA
jgi:hypothetical protein